jgi:hypothetical protein
MDGWMDGWVDRWRECMGYIHIVCTHDMVMQKSSHR